jgi:hypothetical protein
MDRSPCSPEMEVMAWGLTRRKLLTASGALLVTSIRQNLVKQRGMHFHGHLAFVPEPGKVKQWVRHVET